MTLANKSLKLKRRSSRRRRSFQVSHLILMTDEERMPSPESFLSQLPRGASVILRHYSDQNRESLAVRLKDLCRRRGLHLLIGGDWRLAVRVDAYGLHLPAREAAGDLEVGARLWIRRQKKLLTVAAHNPRDVRRAGAIGANAALLSPVFPTKSHPERHHLGPVRCAAITRMAKIAIIALGGVTEKTFNAIYRTKCTGIAGISFILEK